MSVTEITFIFDLRLMKLIRRHKPQIMKILADN